MAGLTKHDWPSKFSLKPLTGRGITFYSTACLFRLLTPSSLAKGFAHGPLSLHPWQIELDFVISADRHLAVFTGLAYKDDITFDQWVLLTVLCLGRCKMAAPSVHVMFP